MNDRNKKQKTKMKKKTQNKRSVFPAHKSINEMASHFVAGIVYDRYHPKDFYLSFLSIFFLCVWGGRKGLFLCCNQFKTDDIT